MIEVLGRKSYSDATARKDSDPGYDAGYDRGMCRWMHVIIATRKLCLGKPSEDVNCNEQANNYASTAIDTEFTLYTSEGKPILMEPVSAMVQSDIVCRKCWF